MPDKIRDLDSELINVLACPDCSGTLLNEHSMLQCEACGRLYEVRDGIPLLYPLRFNGDHMKTEQKLADLMQQPALTGRDRFSAIQWQKSKSEFWTMVEQHVGMKSGAFVNVGCGYDSTLVSFARHRRVLVNFDVTCGPLSVLRRDFGARHCVAGDVNHLPFREGAFDYVICVDVIHHESKNLNAVLEQLCRIQKSGGSIFLEDPHCWGMFQFFKAMLLPRPLYKLLRSTWHSLRRSGHSPANYEIRD